MRFSYASAGLLLVALVALPGAFGRTADDPGIGPRSILIGGTVPLTGDEVAYAAIAFQKELA